MPVLLVDPQMFFPRDFSSSFARFLFDARQMLPHRGSSLRTIGVWQPLRGLVPRDCAFAVQKAAQNLGAAPQLRAGAAAKRYAQQSQQRGGTQ